VAETQGFAAGAPFSSLKRADQDALLYGTGTKKVQVTYKNRYGRSRTYSTAYEGVIPYLQRRHGEVDSDWSREQIESYMREVPCPECGGARLKPESLAVTVDGRSIHDVCVMPIRDAAEVLAAIELSERDRMIAERVVKEINARVGFLLDVGLGYLNLHRNAGTLAGGTFVSQIATRATAMIDVRVPPGITLAELEAEIDARVTAVPSCSWRRVKAWEANWSGLDVPFVQGFADAVGEVRGRPAEPTVRLPASDASRWRALGVPAVCYGPQPTLSAGLDDYAEEQDVFDCAAIYALAAAAFLT